VGNPRVADLTTGPSPQSGTGVRRERAISEAHASSAAPRDAREAPAPRGGARHNGWTCGTAARDVKGRKVRSTSPQATAWCVVGAVDRALYELMNLDVYDLRGLEVDAYDTTPCPSEVLNQLRRPPQRVLGRSDLANWNDHVCPGAAAADRLLREAVKRAGTRPGPVGTIPSR
jgi:hypothetical protein